MYLISGMEPMGFACNGKRIGCRKQSGRQEIKFVLEYFPNEPIVLEFANGTSVADTELFSEPNTIVVHTGSDHMFGGDPFTSFGYFVEHGPGMVSRSQQVDITLKCPSGTSLDNIEKTCIRCSSHMFQQEPNLKSTCCNVGQRGCVVCPSTSDSVILENRTLRCVCPTTKMSFSPFTDREQAESFSECPPQEDKMYDDRVKTICKVVFAINFCLAASFFIWTIKYRFSPIVRLSQPIFLLLVAVGAMVSSVTILVLVFDDVDDENGDARSGNYGPANTACMATVWLYSLGFMITFSPLFLKLWRAKKIFKNATLRKVHIPNSKLLLLCAGVISIDAIIILVWQFTDPLKYYRVTLKVDKFDHVVESGGYCIFRLLEFVYCCNIHCPCNATVVWGLSLLQNQKRE